MDRPKRYLSDEREAAFPNLRKDAYEVTSDEDWAYNCIAHAADKKDLPWWPVEEGTLGVFWPAGVDRVETVDAFAAAFCTQGYRPCEASEDGPGFIEGFEKVALYADAAGVPSHAAKQTESGRWTSKLGDWEDIEHQAPEDLADGADGRPGYGKPVKYLIREIRRTDAAPQEPAQNTEKPVSTESMEQELSTPAAPSTPQPPIDK